MRSGCRRTKSARWCRVVSRIQIRRRDRVRHPHVIGDYDEQRLTFTALTTLVCLLTTRTAVMSADTYTVDPAHTSVVFSVGHTGFSYVYGFFRKSEGSYILDSANPANCQFRFAIQTNSLDTNHAERDTHLRTPDFFNVQQFPTITFVSTSCERANTPDGSVVYNVTGNLTMHGVTQRVTIPLRMLGEGVGPFKDYRTRLPHQFYAQAERLRHDQLAGQQHGGRRGRRHHQLRGQPPRSGSRAAADAVRPVYSSRSARGKPSRGA